MKKILIGILSLVMFLGAFTFTGCNGENTEGYICIDINPSVELVVDRKDKVIAANALNSDAEIVLAGINLIGMNMASAAEIFIEQQPNWGISMWKQARAILMPFLLPQWLLQAAEQAQSKLKC